LQNSAIAAGKRRPVVRAARPDDLDGIVDLELTAFADVYKSSLGGETDPETVAAVRQRFSDRLELLGSWVRILEFPVGNIVGAKIAYPIKLSLEEVVELCDHGCDMRDIEVIRDIFDEDGTAFWSLSLAVAPDAGIISGMSFLDADMRALRAARGIQPTYFLSRLPGLADWAARQLTGVDVTELPSARRKALASHYLRATVQHNGISRIADPLLAMYVDSGAVPVKLVSLWGDTRPAKGVIDIPSLGYHVLCKYGAAGIPADE
jgi:hypothetical protein